MGIIIVEKEKFAVACNGCGSGDDVMLVSAGMNHGHGGFLLCRKCRMELIEKLKASIEKAGGDTDWELNHTDWHNETLNG